ncbi:hypothetical protein [Arthrobacter sp. STN4]|uniref:hypothetical protein n=1 Tax=Arthrobacter sp. STN4 TaxID=2923276 RepID=UPI002119EDBA|nr:hypothetical protein [Arthrobacter sp. STN4]MCQ9165738.1 hypothetical protein [Arthrobacter sp. STN4]
MGCAASAVALAGCITVPSAGPAHPATTSAGPPSYVDRLKAAPVDQPTGAPSAGTLPQFVTDSRNVACVFTTSRAGNLDQPWEPNNYDDGANAKAPTIPVVNCELASYPDPAPADVTDKCAGTFIGYLGGTALLTPDRVTYGGCRAGVTAAEASFGPGGTPSEAMSTVPVLGQGRAMEADGYRCAALDDGVACANLATGLGFFVASGSYELLGPGHRAPAG